MAEYGMGWILMHVLIELGACIGMKIVDHSES